MNVTKHLVCVLAVSALVGGGNAFAQEPVGTTFTYQGQLKQDGEPANGEFDFLFLLYTKKIGGEQVGETLEIADSPVSAGLFTVKLDFGGVFNGEKRWLEVCVRPGNSSGEYTVLSPRQELTAIPYAIYALNGGGGGGGNTLDDAYDEGGPGAGRIIIADSGPVEIRDSGDLGLIVTGKVGIGISEPTEKLQVAGTIHSTSGGFKFPDDTLQTTAAEPGIGGGGTVNYIPKFTDSRTIGDSLIYESGGNVVIGAGVAIDSAPQTGIQVREPGSTGIYVDDAGGTGILVSEGNSTGILVRDAARFGIEIRDSASTGLDINNPGNHGIDITEAEQYGIRISLSGREAGYFVVIFIISGDF